MTTTRELNSIRMFWQGRLIADRDLRRRFRSSAGKEHYRLLASWSLSHVDSVFLDFSSDHGSAALALSMNHRNTVFSFGTGDRCLSKTPTNVAFIDDELVVERYDNLVRLSSFVFLDMHDDWRQENQILEHLVDLNWHGTVLLGSTNVNAEKGAFVDSLSHVRVDVTHLGHRDGMVLVTL